MIKLKQLYLEPAIASGKAFEPIRFIDGINIIVGQKSSDDFSRNEQEKMNSVGKSLSIEMINFCLLKDAASSRIQKIPGETLPLESYICLDFEYEDSERVVALTVRRPKNSTQSLILLEDEVEIEFEDVEECKAYLSKYFFDDAVKTRPSLRQLLSILIRDETSGYNDILRPNANSYQSASLVAPHAYLFGFDIDPMKNFQAMRKDIKSAATNASEYRKRITSKGIKVAAVQSYINDLDERVSRLGGALRQLKAAEGATQLKDELNDLYDRLDKLTTRRVVRADMAYKIKSLPKPEDVKPAKMRQLFDKYHAGLGSIVEKSFTEVQNFRHEIYEFQNELMSTKLADINSEIIEIDKEIDQADGELSILNKRLGVDGKIGDLKDSILKEQADSSELESLRSAYDDLQRATRRKTDLLKARTRLIDEIAAQLDQLSAAIEQFEDDLKEMHQFIADNQRCQFGIEVKDAPTKTDFTNFMEFNYRVDLDGGSGLNRIKTFIYDALLLTSKATRERHPRLLIHDNIFASAGLEDTVRSLNYLQAKYDAGIKFQYIFTINLDEFENKKSAFNFDADAHTIRSLTRENQLLGAKYREI